MVGWLGIRSYLKNMLVYLLWKSQVCVFVSNQCTSDVSGKVIWCFHAVGIKLKGMKCLMCVSYCVYICLALADGGWQLLNRKLSKLLYSRQIKSREQFLLSTQSSRSEDGMNDGCYSNLTRCENIFFSFHCIVVHERTFLNLAPDTCRIIIKKTKTNTQTNIFIQFKNYKQKVKMK